MKRIVWVTLVLGVWLVVAPFVLGYSFLLGATANDVIFGVVLIACSWWILTRFSRELGVALVQALCSVWLIVAPFVLVYQPWSTAMINDLFAGIIALIVTMAALRAVATSPAKAG